MPLDDYVSLSACNNNWPAGALSYEPLIFMTLPFTGTVLLGI